MQRRNFVTGCLSAAAAAIASLFPARPVQATPETLEPEFVNPVENSYFVFDDENLGTFLDQGHSEAGAVNEAESYIPDHCDEGWDESVENIRVGIITHVSCKVNEREPTDDELEYHPHLESFTVCDYEMQETEEYQALKQMLREHALMKRILADRGIDVPEVTV